MQLNDVEVGGSTVFPIAKARVPAKKGSAAFWYNLHANGEGNLATLHASCPVLIGFKWRKWVICITNQRNMNIFVSKISGSPVFRYSAVRICWPLHLVRLRFYKLSKINHNIIKLDWRQPKLIVVIPLYVWHGDFKILMANAMIRYFVLLRVLLPTANCFNSPLMCYVYLVL